MAYERVIFRNMSQLNKTMKGRLVYVETPIPDDMVNIEVTHKVARGYIKEIWDWNETNGNTGEGMYYNPYHLPVGHVYPYVMYLSRDADWDGEWDESNEDQREKAW